MSKYGNFGGTTAGNTTEREVYPSFGYNSKYGNWMVGSKEDENGVQKLKEITFVPLAKRRCKEVGWEDEDLKFHATNRYPIYTKQTDMVQDQPDKQNRVQVLGIVNGELRVWGASSYTVDAFWHNPTKGSYSNPSFEDGYWKVLGDFVKAESKEAGVSLSPFCFESTLRGSDEPVEVGSGRKKSETYPILVVGEPRFVGEAKAAEYNEFYTTEDLDAWITEWEGAPEEVVEDEMVDPNDEQGGEQPPVMMTDDTEMEEIPF